MKINKTTTHQRRTFVHLDEKQLKRLLSEAVAREAGISLEEQHVTVNVVISTRDSVGSGIERYAEVTITEDLSQLPDAA